MKQQRINKCEKYFRASGTNMSLASSCP